MADSVGAKDALSSESVLKGFRLEKHSSRVWEYFQDY